MSRSSNEADRPISLNERRPVAIPIGALLAAVGTLLGATAAAAIAYNRVDARGEDHETRIQKVEVKTEDIAVIKTDVAWIKRMMEDDRRSRGVASKP